MGRATRELASGLSFGEGPRWHEGRLWFSDFYVHAVRSVSPAGDLRTEFTLDDQPSGLGWQPDGTMLIVSMKQRRLLRRAADGAIGVHADLSHIATFHCNDMVVDAQGGAYVGNFGFNLDEAVAKGDVAGNLVMAKLAYVSPDGQARVAADDIAFPNGTVITPDGKTLIIGESFGRVLTAFDVGPGGDLSNRRVWADLGSRAPDGICLDGEGAIWVANPMAPECVRVAEGGKVLEVIDTGQPCYACMLGGDDGKTLFMLTAANSNSEAAAASRTGKVLVAMVESPRAGLP
ncbi:SMP-30/gluconolactonase/LRE family protein [uncultured Phenylobacterium sp.]|uniref:SMP-30/gluconolactonase/LRE family protein n=1 Tax=uncultured Phenylobacterium sp. TaxID=349273 RepID=UPI0025DDE5C2|nr:SMP-30/gluconolactonase/LRE family protein [uncultured Phenylobacterium sp.]